mgnify:CR=1 FL=1
MKKNDEDKVKLHDLLVGVYLDILPSIRSVAKEHGYSVAIHGSLKRDFDIIAFPWTEECSDKDTLILEIGKRIGKEVKAREAIERKDSRPHNRTAYDIQLGCGMYLDLSVYAIK